MRSRRAAWIERTLFVVGFGCLAWYGLVTVEGYYYRQQQVAVLERLIEAREAMPSAPDTAQQAPLRAPVADAGDPETPPAQVAADEAADLEAVAAPAVPPAGRHETETALAGLASRGAIGLLEIPRLGLSTPVLADDDELTLKRGIGHLPDTPRPWERGNSAIAGHRDTEFRPLRNIRLGDELRVRTLEGDLRYRVRETKIVMPDDLSVLRPTERSTLTLITCYPFNYIGNAPQRFIVHAERIED